MTQHQYQQQVIFFNYFNMPINLEELKNKLDKRLKGFQLKFPLDPTSQRIVKDLIFLPITTKVMGTNAATSINYGIFFVNPLDRAFRVFAISEVHGTAGTDGSAVTLQIERLQGTESLGNGDDLLSSTINLKGTANTVQHGSLVTNGQLLILEKGDRLALKQTGTATSVADVAVTIILKNA